MSVVTRFAPSPSGKLHLGHAYSALRAWDFACQHNGTFLLRIEDIDFNRCRREFEDLLKVDLAWLGIEWAEPTRRQSEHLTDFNQVIDRLFDMGLLYPCFCTRKEILAEIARSGAAPHGSEGPVYPGTCRDLSIDERTDRMKNGRDYAVRLDLQASLNKMNSTLSWNELEDGEVIISEADWFVLGDVVLARKDIQTSYHVAVVVDDAMQDVTHVIRGRDLYEATRIHILLQALLDFPQPIYMHHELIVDEHGKRLAKRDESETISAIRTSGGKVAEIRDRLGLPI